MQEGIIYYLHMGYLGFIHNVRGDYIKSTWGLSKSST
jgi:hypothetical protein